MNLKLLSLIALIIAVNIQLGEFSKKNKINTRDKFSDKQCILFNDKYSNAFLYSEPTALTSLRHVYAWDPVFKTKKPTAQFIVNNKASVWIIIPVANRPKTFFIKNDKTNEYLHPASYLKKGSSNRVVYTSPYKSDDDLDTLMWNFYKLDNGKYQIWNVKFNEGKFFFTYNFFYK